MRVKEAIELLRTHNDKCSGCDKLCNDLCKPAVEVAIKALEKQIPQKPINPDDDYGTFECPNCGGTIYASDALKDHKYCLLCGQAIDWYTGNQGGE